MEQSVGANELLQFPKAVMRCLLVPLSMLVEWVFAESQPDSSRWHFEAFLLATSPTGKHKDNGYTTD
jgi:hypothetical protein